MEYIYDIVLNFNDCYYEFYEWNSKDKIINVKKIKAWKKKQNYNILFHLGITSIWPILNKLLVKLFTFFKLETLTPNLSAMLYKLSPDFTI